MPSPETPKTPNPFGPAAVEFIRAQQDLLDALEKGDLAKANDAIARGDAAERSMEEENLNYFIARNGLTEMAIAQPPVQTAEQKLQN